eukprot:TRINITY_DN847_c0_g1_i1.p1 TRINITY_DN847_c0_g1~~TRINITY_DN847_c0_g1_i1.p1  ORF type:complete len:252 (-),score=28.06 TRINITY_DN847_c0_g1_i1:430-1161(-)
MASGLLRLAEVSLKLVGSRGFPAERLQSPVESSKCRFFFLCSGLRSSDSRSRALISSVRPRQLIQTRASVDSETTSVSQGEDASQEKAVAPPSGSLERDVNKVVSKAAATFAPRASTASKNPAQPGTTLYSIFEVQGYLSILVGGALSFNLIFPSDEPDLWRLMGMWSVWMFAIPSLRARDCSKQEKEALNYLFLLVPLINVTLPLVWRSFAAVWSADVLAFAAMYAWKVGLPKDGSTTKVDG